MHETKIATALTAEEWAEVGNAPWNFDDAVAVEPKECASLIALNNHALPDSDPRKITREKIEHMRAIAAALLPKLPNESHAGFLAEWADALESYLPPA